MDFPSIPASNSQTGTEIAKTKVVKKTQEQDQSQFEKAKVNANNAAYDAGSSAKASEAQLPLETVVENLDAFMSKFNKNLSFRMDEASGRPVVTVYEVSSGDIIRQIPEKEALELAQHLSTTSGSLFKETI